MAELKVDLGPMVETLKSENIWKHVRKEGNQYIIDPEVSHEIAHLKLFQTALSVIEKEVKHDFTNLSSEFNSVRFDGDHVLVSVQTAPQYEIAEGYKRQWTKTKITHTPDNDKIESFVKLNGTLPEGVSMKDTSPVVKFYVR